MSDRNTVWPISQAYEVGMWTYEHSSWNSIRVAKNIIVACVDIQHFHGVASRYMTLLYSVVLCYGSYCRWIPWFAAWLYIDLRCVVLRYCYFSVYCLASAWLISS
jgi:hypothetical protein